MYIHISFAFKIMKVEICFYEAHCYLTLNCERERDEMFYKSFHLKFRLLKIVNKILYSNSSLKHSNCRLYWLVYVGKRKKWYVKVFESLKSVICGMWNWDNDDLPIHMFI